MLNPQQIENMAKQFTEALPLGLRQTAQGVEEQFKKVLQGQLNKLDIVSREEFEIQQQMLLKMRKRLDELTVQVQQMQKQCEADANLDKA
tara:strand:- start:9615 stop:9884 length:270 start_codon:yes stop_codon:yes gene_type:complete